MIAYRTAFAALVAAVAVFTTGAARAVADDKFEVGAALEADVLRGQHGINEPGTPQPFGLYFLEPDVRYGRLTARVEYLPFTPRLPGLATNLKILVPEARYAIGRHALIGLGETIYNQTSTFPDVTERSRMAGLRFIAGAPLDAGGSVVTFAATPRMHGHVHDECFGTVINGGRACLAELFRSTGEADEVGSQVDAEARWYFATRSPNTKLFVGLRYVNFIAQITYPDHRDVDHNQGAGIQFGIRTAYFGR